MKVKDITSAIESTVPLAWQDADDNAGLTVGDPEAEVHSVLVALDVTEEVVAEAVGCGADMIVTHHPIIYRPVSRIACQSPQARAIAEAIRRGIALYACHTNLDSAPELGINHLLGRMLGLTDTAVLVPTVSPEVGFGIVGSLAEPVKPELFLQRIKKVLGLKMLRHSPVKTDSVSRVAVCSGAGASFIGNATESGADLYLTADLKYHDFGEADRMILVDAGHFETEICAIEILFDILSKKIPTFALRKSSCSRNPVNYMV